MDSFEVRREYLRQGGKLRETARALGTSHQNVQQHVERANRLAPLTYQQGTAEDRAAVGAYIRAALARVGVSLPAQNPPSDSPRDPERVPAED